MVLVEPLYLHFVATVGSLLKTTAKILILLQHSCNNFW